MQSIYLDYNSTTPADPLVLDTMMPYFSEKFGNAASHTHAWGWTAAGVVEKARQEVAALINAGPEEIIFTSGATEAINLAMRGVMEVYAVKGKHLIVAATEHKAVLDTAEDLQRKGVIVDYLSVDREGRIDLSALEQTIRPDTVLVCVMMANNETGTMQPVEEIARICKAKETLFLCDTTQAIGKTRVDVQELGLHLCTISAHKMYGPKGIGALYVRRKEPRVKLVAEITGGGHERGLRSGTLNVPAIVGFGTAAHLAKQNTWDYGMHTSKWRTILEQHLTEDGRGFINGCIRARIPNTTNITFPGIKAGKLIKAIPEIGISMGSACSSALPQPSHVLKAMGLSDEEIYSSVRISLGKETTEEEIRQAILRIGGALEKLRKS